MFREHGGVLVDGACRGVQYRALALANTSSSFNHFHIAVVRRAMCERGETLRCTLLCRRYSRPPNTGAMSGNA